jgi:hypothetical protein
MRGLYESHAEAMSRYLCMTLPPWFDERPHKDNWQTVARLRAQAERESDDVGGAGAPPPLEALASLDDHHDF